MHDICVVILCYNRIEYTKKCIDSFIKYAPKNWSIVFVDNGSEDGTREYLSKRFSGQENVKILFPEDNLYPGGGYKLGLKEVFKSKHYLICDNDGLFIDNEWFKKSTEVMKDKRIGLVNLRISRWREDHKFGKNVKKINGHDVYITTHVASFSLLSDLARRHIVGKLRGKWIGGHIGRCVIRGAMKSCVMKEGLIFDQSENDLDNPEYREQYLKLWKEKGRLSFFQKATKQLQNEKIQKPD